MTQSNQNTALLCDDADEKTAPVATLIRFVCRSCLHCDRLSRPIRVATEQMQGRVQLMTRFVETCPEISLDIAKHTPSLMLLANGTNAATTFDTLIETALGEWIESVLSQ